MSVFESKRDVNPYVSNRYHHVSHVLQAARAPIGLDECQANAVAARMELDLRIGSAFTRLQTLRLQSLAEELSQKILSYGELSMSH